MKYYEVSLIKEQGVIKKEFSIDIFEFTDKFALLKYFSENYPPGVNLHVRQVDEEEAGKIREKRKRELEENVTMAMSQIHWKVGKQHQNNMEKSYAIMTRGKLLGVMEFSNREEMQRYINLYPILVFCGEIDGKENARIIRRQIRRELKEPVNNLTKKLWGHIPKLREDNQS